MRPRSARGPTCRSIWRYQGIAKPVRTVVLLAKGLRPNAKASPPLPAVAPERRNRQERRRRVIYGAAVIHGIRRVGTVGIPFMPMLAACTGFARPGHLRLLRDSFRHGGRDLRRDAEHQCC